MKPKTKKILKVGIPTLIGAGSIGLIVGISTSWNNVSIISLAGSSAVMPLMNSLGNIYNKADIVTESGGSGVGINSILHNKKEIGMASKNPSIIELGQNDEKYKIWKQNKCKTITIAWDGMALIYKPSRQNEKIDLNDENFAKLYTCFSGVKKLTFNDFLNNNDLTTIKPFARTGGASFSGTADAFYKDSKSDYQNSTYWNNLSVHEKNAIKNALETGSYNVNNVTETAEANKQAWDRVKNESAGSMVYLSAGFVLNNLNEIKNKGFEIATYNGVELSNETIAQGYKWYRPFNLMFSLNRISSSSKQMMNWILFNEEAKNIILKNGYINLNENQIKSMVSQNDQNLSLVQIKEQNLLFKPEADDCTLNYSGAIG